MTLSIPAASTDLPESLVGPSRTTDLQRNSCAATTFGTDGLVRWELQARIVAEQPAAQIAERPELSVSAVPGFETDCFDVLSCLEQSSRMPTACLVDRCDLYE